MTKEKALEIFKFMLKSGKGTIDYWNGTIPEQRAAIEMAIKALEQKPSDDCVSRKELYNHCFDATIIGKSGKSITRGILLEDEIDGLPPVTPTRKSGLCWIERFDNESMWLECPHCHMDSIAAYNYCPNCGASFKEEKRGKEVQAIPLDKVKQAREEISKSCYKACITDDGDIKESKVLAILDKLIESEG